VKRAFS